MYGSVATISFQAETITLAGTMGRDVRERLSLVFWGAVFLLIPSLLGLNQAITTFVGEVVVYSMMAGVGIMLAYVAIDLLKSEPVSGAVSMVSALIVWLITCNLAYTVIISVLASAAVYIVVRYVPSFQKSLRIPIEDPSIHPENERFRFGSIEWAFWKNRRILVAALSIACLNTGANISFGLITGSIANTPTNVDHLAVYSSLFGCGPVEAIISGTATAPNPLLSSVIMMSAMAIILLLKLLPVIGKFVHRSSIAGFLFVLGPVGIVIGVTVLVTARFNPFFGLVSGLVLKLILGL